MSITEITVPLYEVAWLPWAVQYFFFIGLSTTALLLASVAHLVGHQRWQRLQPAALLVAVSAGLVAPVALLADLHQPGRFWHFYAHFTPWSWMSIGSVLLPAYFATLLTYALIWQRERLRSLGGPRWLAWLARGAWSGAKALPWLAGLAAALALGVLVYTGSEIMVVRARPLWHTYWLLPNLALTALLAAVAATIFAQHWVTGTSTDDARFSLRLLSLALLATALGAVGWGLSGWMLQSGSFTEAVRLFRHFGYWRWVFIGSALLGVLGLCATVLVSRRPALLSRSWMLAPLALASAWAFRWVVLMRVQTVPKYGAGLYPYQLPLGSDGLMGVIATFGLWVAVFIMLSSVLNASKTGNLTIPEIAHA